MDPNSSNTFNLNPPNQQGQDAQGKKSARPVWQQSIQQISSIMRMARDYVVVTRPHPDLDTLVASVTLSVSLQKLGGTSMVISPTPVDPAKVFAGVKKEDVPQLLIDQIRGVAQDFDQKQLNLTVDFKEGTFLKGAVEESDKELLLKLVPQEGQKPIKPLNISTDLVEHKPAVVMTVGVDDVFNLGDFYQNHQDMFSKKPVINIDNQAKNSNYGQVNLIDPKATSLAEVVTLMLYDLRFTFDRERAQMLYLAIKQATNNFDKEKFTANMLEASSICLRYIQAPQPKM